MERREVYKKIERERIATMLEKIDRLELLSNIYEYAKLALDCYSQEVKGGVVK